MTRGVFGAPTCSCKWGCLRCLQPASYQLGIMTTPAPKWLTIMPPRVAPSARPMYVSEKVTTAHTAAGELGLRQSPVSPVAARPACRLPHDC